jgi:checkpoint serine/threonine-protein kinase
MDSLFTPLRPVTTSPPKATPTTDYTVIESQKENIRPLASGRSAATLGALFSSKDAEAERVIKEGHEKYKMMIEESLRRDREGEDMLEGVQDVLDVFNQYYHALVMIDLG